MKQLYNHIIKIATIALSVIVVSLFSCSVSAELLYDEYNLDFGTVRVTGFNSRQIEIAKHLLKCEERFSVPFEGLQDYNNDLFFANTQNPLTSFVKEFRTSIDGKMVTYSVKYWVNPNNAKKWIPEEYKKAKQIATAINKSYKTNYAKYQAINLYLCRNSEYNFKASKYVGVSYQAMNNQPVYIQSAYAPYGVLCYGKGVCQSYAQAYHLICDMLELPCISVKGKLDGGNHIWNRVQINGKWYNMDVSENDVSGKYVTYFAPSGISKVYVEDKLYWCPYNQISDYKANIISREYYYRKGKFIKLDDICDYLDRNYFSQRKRPIRITVRVRSNLSAQKTCDYLAETICDYLIEINRTAVVNINGSLHGVYCIEFDYI